LFSSGAFLTNKENGMELIYRSGKFVIKLDEKDKADANFESSIKDFILSNRLLAGDIGDGFTVRHTPETESNFLSLASRYGKTIHCEGVYRRGEIFLDIQGNVRDKKRSDRLAVTEQREYPLEGIDRKIYDELVLITDTRQTSSDEVYKVVVKEYKANNGHFEITSESSCKIRNANEWAKARRLKI
jgi:hypothetical protein